MRKNDTQMKKSELLPFHIIKAASEGDVEAIRNIYLQESMQIERSQVQKLIKEKNFKD